MEKVSIPECFKDKDIFITGGTGFLGKALIEKLLRSCSQLNQIYVLVRNKKGKSAKERLKETLSEELFDKVREKLNEKVTAIEGDVMLNRLGISDDDLNILKNVSIIFHSAASVRFDDPLKDAILMNVRGTLETYKLAERLNKVEAFIHVSTTYSNPEIHVVEEKLYPATVDWRTAIKLAESYSTETLNIFNLKFGGFQPNTYTFTKGIAEQIADHFKDKLPVLIYRPSIIVSSIEEPIPGWIDNFNGPVGLFVGSGVGIIRIVYGDPDVCLDYMPVDVAVKGMIVATYLKCLENHDTHTLQVYNCSTATLRPIKTGDVCQMARELIWDDPMEQTFWYPNGFISSSKTFYYFYFLIFHVLVAIVGDSVIRLLRHKPFLLKLQRKVFGATIALQYFNTTHFSFQNDKFYKLDECIPPSDRADFAYKHLTDIDIKLFFKNALIGAKYFLLKQPMKSTKLAKFKFQAIFIIDFVVRFLFWGFVLKTIVMHIIQKLFVNSLTSLS